VFAGPAPARIEQLNQYIVASGGVGVLTPGGQLSPATQSALIDGLDLDEFTQDLVAWLDPTASINFLVYDNGVGGRFYIAPRLLSAAEINIFNRNRHPMTFADVYPAAVQGSYIAIAEWAADDGDLTKWLLLQGGVWFVGPLDNLAIVTSERGATPGNITISEMRAKTWFSN